eukprot:TRINITY_DN8133_c0_g1_i1.p1 TRINITY_DN8133_c0_g1~~TRINITY_DN8133_c0_g1_i1.p1  ORF type:complete len:972 (+),score=440.52 TRINITY_DN8133_c0_g1_i1:887-3802(+)
MDDQESTYEEEESYEEETVEEVEEVEELEEVEEDEDQEEFEDQLKYERLKIDGLVAHDAVSVMAVGKRFLVVGTQMGWLHVVDFIGTPIHQYQHHSAPITDISIDDNCDYVGACSTDGMVSVGSLFGETSFNQMFDRPVKAIAIDPNYQSNNRFITGGLEKKLILIDKSTFLRRWQQTVLYTEQGAIRAIKWHKNFVAWADDKGVKVYDITAKQKITRVDMEKSSHLAELYRCNLVWEQDNTLLIAWANRLIVCIIKQRPAFLKVGDPSLPDRCGEVTHKFIMENYFVSGIAPFGKRLLMLTYPDDTLKREKGVAAPRPELRIIDRTNRMNEIEKNSMSLAGYENLLAKDYQLAFDENDENEKVFYVLSPHEIVVCKPCDANDKVNWLISRKRFEDAIRCVKEQDQYVGSHIWQRVGELYLVHLVDNGEYEKAASLFREFLGTDTALWQKWIVIYNQKDKIDCIIDVIPINKEVNLGDAIYAMILQFFLWKKFNPVAFYNAIREWPRDLYDPAPIITHTKQKLADMPKPEILDPPPTAGTTMSDCASADVDADNPYNLISLALALLYEKEGMREEALKIHLDLGRSDVFDFIDRHNLHQTVENNVVQLLWKNQTRALAMLVKHHHTIRVNHVVSQLKDRRAYLYKYLDLLYREDSKAADNHITTLLELHAEFAPDKLLPFIRTAQSHQSILDAAAEISKKRVQLDTITEEERKDLYRVQAFVAGRLGERHAALEILISKIKSVKESIDFIVEQNDEDLFEVLVNACLDGGQNFVADLLEHLGEAEGPTKAIEPLDLINRIKPDMEIPDLKSKLIRIMRDQALRKYLKEGCLKVLEKDVSHLGEHLFKAHSRAVAVDVGDTHSCSLCEQPLRLQTRKPQGAVVFRCNHSYHLECYMQKVEGPKYQQPPAPTGRSSRPTVRRRNGICVRVAGVTAGSYLRDENPKCPLCSHTNQKIKPPGPASSSAASKTRFK